MPHVAANCIDDDEVTTMCHSLEQDSPWISIELPKHTLVTRTMVSQIVVYNRYDGSFDRLAPFQLWVGASAGDYNSSTSAACGLQDLVVPPTRGPFAFDCVSAGGGSGSPLEGEYVTLVLPGAGRTLNLAIPSTKVGFGW